MTDKFFFHIFFNNTCFVMFVCLFSSGYQGAKWVMSVYMFGTEAFGGSEKQSPRVAARWECIFWPKSIENRPKRHPHTPKRPHVVASVKQDAKPPFIRLTKCLSLTRQNNYQWSQGEWCKNDDYCLEGIDGQTPWDYYVTAPPSEKWRNYRETRIQVSWTT